MTKNIRSIALLAALAVILVAGVVAQQKAADTAVDPVCGMTVVKANAKATFDYKGTTYYFCNTGCKESFAKEPDKYLKAQQAKAAGAAAGAPAGHGPDGAHGRPDGRANGHDEARRHGRLRDVRRPVHDDARRQGHGHARPRHDGAGGPMAPLFKLYGDKIEVTVENAKDGAALKITSKDPEVVKAIQVHLAEHVAMMKKMKEAVAVEGQPVKK